jgi:endonuclease/exonuclease/phosphatase family metal-dependent hydrolase
MRAWFAAAGAVLLAGCGSTDDGSGPAEDRGFTLVTFNTALGVGLAPYPDERLGVIARDLGTLGADVVCLQEVWQLQQTQLLAAAASADFPYAYYSVAAVGDPTGVPPCTDADTAALASCLAQSCAGLTGDAAAQCAVNACSAVFATVSTSCQQCVAANQSTDLDVLLTTCGSSGTAAEYQDQNGLLLLSRLPLAAQDTLVLESSLGDRGVLSAQVQSDQLGLVNVLCTHLAATLPDVPYDGQYTSWAGERAVQIDALVAYAADRQPVALLGDMNCGPDEDPAGFARFAAAGYADPYAGACTWCTSNPMTGGGADAILDHVLLRGLPADVAPEARRVLDDQVSIEVDGSSLETYRSDHFGVAVTLP